jgi:hypothetical protein
LTRTPTGRERDTYVMGGTTAGQKRDGKNQKKLAICANAPLVRSRSLRWRLVAPSALVLCAGQQRSLIWRIVKLPCGGPGSVAERRPGGEDESFRPRDDISRSVGSVESSLVGGAAHGSLLAVFAVRNA